MQNFKGNLVFASKNSFFGRTLSRRDDLISLTYLMVYLLDGDLVFMKDVSDSSQSGSNYERYQQKFYTIGMSKKQLTGEQLCQTKESKYLLPFIKEVYKIGFQDEPNYLHLELMLINQLFELNLLPDNMYDWNSDCSLDPYNICREAPLKNVMSFKQLSNLALVNNHISTQELRIEERAPVENSVR